MTNSTCIAPRSTDIVSCSVCSKEQERYLFVTEKDYHINDLDQISLQSNSND